MTLPIDNDEIFCSLSPLDRDALTRAIEIVRSRGAPAARQQIENFLQEQPWPEVAKFAAYGCQRRALRLKLWQPVPYYINDIEATLEAGDDGIRGQYQAARLLQRMLDAGLSRYEPDPVAALEAAASRRTA
jgi:hypothetical protein